MNDYSCCNFKSNKLINKGKKVNGILSLVEISDVHYVIKFIPKHTLTSVNNSNEELYDLEDLTFDYIDDELHIKINSFNQPDTLFQIIDENEMMLFQETVQECRAVCDITLRLQSIIRDIYYSGIYSQVNSDNKYDLSKQLGNICFPKDNIDLISINNIKNLIEYDDENDMNKRSKFKNGKSITFNKSELISIHCSYCEIESKIITDREFLIHPYVPKDYDNNPLYLCIICANNWKDYRDKAEIENSLLLPDEVNEEICSFCSDLPTEIILCSKCPKSYCQGCLKRVLSTAAFNELLNDNDWQCMSCCSDNPLIHPLPRNAWKTFLHKDIDSMIQQGKIVYPSNNTEVISRTPKSTRTNRSTSISKKQIDCSTLPPVDIKVDEIYYFQQYILFYSNLCKLCNIIYNNKQRNNQTLMDSTPINNNTTTFSTKNSFCTDDTCFLCKDGGELIECDWIMPGRKESRCRKVYHEYCLSYSVDDNVEWYCPRHFCDICGSLNVRFLCLYCPISICSKCPEELVKLYGHANYIELEVPNTGEITKRSIVPIACQSCINMFEKCKLRGNLIAKDIIDEMLSKPIKRFPGQYNNQNMKVTGIFKKWETKHYKIDDESKELDMEFDLTDSNMSFLNKTEVSNESVVIESESSKFETNDTIITDSTGNNIITSPKSEKNHKKIKSALRNISIDNNLHLRKDNQSMINDFENSTQLINYSLTDSDPNIENIIDISNLTNINDNNSATDSDPSMEIIEIQSNTVNTNSNNSRESKKKVVESHIESEGDSNEYETLYKTPKKGKWSFADIEDLQNAYSIYGNNISSILNDARFIGLKLRAEAGIQKKLDVYDAINQGSLQVKSNESSQEQADSQTDEVQKVSGHAKRDLNNTNEDIDMFDHDILFTDHLNAVKTIEKSESVSKKRKSLDTDAPQLDEQIKLRRSTRVFQNIVKVQKTILDTISSQNSSKVANISENISNSALNTSSQTSVDSLTDAIISRDLCFQDYKNNTENEISCILNEIIFKLEGF